MRTASILLSAVLLATILAGVRAGEATLSATLPEKAGLFEKIELTLVFPPDVQNALDELPDTQIHDAYDADRNGTYVRAWAEFSGPDEKCVVPAFAMREKVDGPWSWRVRFSPRHLGAFSAILHLDSCFGSCGKSTSQGPTELTAQLPGTMLVEDHGLPGPLVMPENDKQPALLRRKNAAGGSDALWLFGACRAWVAETQDSKNEWPDEWLDRDTELFPPMRASGYNLLNQWMAPWEFMLIHHDRAEYWKDAHDKFQRTPLPEKRAWSSYQCLDQGRAAAFDQLVEKCEGGKDKDLIYLLLSPLPHNALESSAHAWSSQESGFSPDDDKLKQSLERLNGFSGFPQTGTGPKAKTFDIWSFFAADPAKPLDDWRSQLFDHQANFYRYVIARWGYSRAVGVWVLADELDAVGDEVGNFKIKTGWWGHAECELWLANLVRLFHGGLKRSDGLAYAGDPFHHPLHAASTSSRGQARRGGNIDWDGGPAGAQPDVLGFHWYPYWPKDSTWSDVWEYVIDGVESYARAPIGNHPRLMSEFGAEDRGKPTDEASYLYPTLYHHAIWAAIFNGHAGTPMDWDDGKEFGDLFARKRPGIFDAEHYPIDNPAQLRALRKFLALLKPEELLPCSAFDAKVVCTGRGEARASALYEPKHTSVYGWMFTRGGESTMIALRGVMPGTYMLTWYDPWTGEQIDAPGANGVVTIAATSGPIGLDAKPALKALSPKEEFPKKTRLSRGQDVAFRLEFLEKQ